MEKNIDLQFFPHSRHSPAMTEKNSLKYQNTQAHSPHQTHGHLTLTFKDSFTSLHSWDFVNSQTHSKDSYFTPHCTHGNFGTHNTHRLTPPHCTHHNLGTHNTHRLNAPHCTHNLGTHNTHRLTAPHCTHNLGTHNTHRLSHPHCTHRNLGTRLH